MKKILLIVTVLLILFVNAYSQQLSKDEKDILEIQDTRNKSEIQKLIGFLKSSDRNIVYKALYALANIADTNSAEMTDKIFIDKFDSETENILINKYAFYLGQTGGNQSIKILRKISQTTNTTQPEVLNAIGKIANDTALNDLSEHFLTHYIEDDNINNAVAISLARFALRKIKSEQSVDLLKYLVDVIRDDITRQNLAFAIWRTGDKSLLKNVREQIYNLAHSKDAQTRMWAYNAMGKLQDKLLLTYILESFNSENDWRVKVNMLNSLTNYKLDSITDLTSQLMSALDNAIGDENEHVSLTAINVLGKLYNDLKNSSNETAKSQSEDLKGKFREALPEQNLSWRVRSELANSMSLIFKDEVKEDLFKVFSSTNDYDLKGGVVKAFGNFDNGMVYKEVRDSISAEVKRYNEMHPDNSGEMIVSPELGKMYRGFVDMLSNLDEKVDEENQNTFRLIFTEFAGSKDPLIADISLTALKDSMYMKYRDETISVMQFDYAELEYPKDIDVNLIFIDAMKELHNDKTITALEQNLKSENYEIAKASADALESITGKKYNFDAKPRTDFDWSYFEKLPQKKFIVLKTNKGNIKIELLPDVAPFTVMNFLKLAEKNFYDNTIFHRVVSNFVIQGGDPTGTGYGGPGYSIRSEFSPLTYETGMVGMASSGKDTEGSQFFITHSATPHLDGKYTIFGKVTAGMDVVDKIMIGDYIEDIIITPK